MAKEISGLLLAHLGVPVHLENCSLFPRLVEPFHPRIMGTIEFNNFFFSGIFDAVCTIFYQKMEHMVTSL